MSEFGLIQRHFTWPVPAGWLGPGDDCALLPAAPGALAVSTDLLLEGRHFFADVDPRALGHKALAVNLSDLAAMGARPHGAVLGLALSTPIDDAWLAAFAAGWRALAERHGCPLVGGDTTRAEQGRQISVTVMGTLDARRALRRDQAQVGDDIWVGRPLGAAHVALQLLLAEQGLPAEAWVAAMPLPERQALLAQTRAALEWPEPQVALGLALQGVAHAAIDISDGLLQDLGHILKASGVGASLDWPELPCAPGLAQLPLADCQQAVLGGGDVYGLCFTAPASARALVLARAQAVGESPVRIGQITAQPDLRVLDAQGLPLSRLPAGFDHFSPSCGGSVPT